MATSLSHVGAWGVSEQLRTFVEETPHERRSILAFLREVADSLPPGSEVLEIRARDTPYRELFSHCDYLTRDWEDSLHEGAHSADPIASVEPPQLDDAAVDAVLLAHLLEHVADPAAVLREAARVLRPGGGVFLTVPFVWELHDPHDFWRFTPASIDRLLELAGFVEVRVEARNDCFTTVAQLLRNLNGAMGRAPDGRDDDREAAAELLEHAAERIAALSDLDVERILPLGWAASARLPEDR